MNDTYLINTRKTEFRDMESDSLEPKRKAGRFGRLLCFMFISAIRERASREPYSSKRNRAPAKHVLRRARCWKNDWRRHFAAASKARG
jgi:hypothetical protein